MLNWKPIEDDPPFGEEVLLWLKADVGYERPIGMVIATYKNTSMGQMWVQKDATGGINNGLRTDLITHYCLLEGEPDERPIC